MAAEYEFIVGLSEETGELAPKGLVFLYKKHVCNGIVDEIFNMRFMV